MMDKANWRHYHITDDLFEYGMENEKKLVSDRLGSPQQANCSLLVHLQRSRTEGSMETVSLSRTCRTMTMIRTAKNATYTSASAIQESFLFYLMSLKRASCHK